MKKLLKDVKAIMADLETDCLTIDCCNYSVQGTLLTHCYYDAENDKLHFTSGDMENDKHAEEIILTDEQIKDVLTDIIECYD
jgi:hypothetical protein